MDTGNVHPYNVPAAGADVAEANAFNAQNHAKTDVNFDLSALVRYEPNEVSTNEFGYSRKTRSPGTTPLSFDLPIITLRFMASTSQERRRYGMAVNMGKV